MEAKYHRQITSGALQGKVSPAALSAIIRANLHQDSLSGLFGHPEYHFDSNTFLEGNRYIDSQRATLQDSLTHGDPVQAWQAFGRLIHTAQDFYAHSNYVPLWAEAAGSELPDPWSIDPLDTALLEHPGLKSGKIYDPFDLLVFIPILGWIIKPLMPRDSHTWMNIDSPNRSLLFPWVIAAAGQRTLFEFATILDTLHRQGGTALVSKFTDLPIEMP